MLFSVLIFSLTGCGRQSDGTMHVGQEDASYVQEAELGKDWEERLADGGTPWPEVVEAE